MSKAGAARLVPTSSLLVRDIQLLATLDTELGDIRDAAIYIEGKVIKWVGAAAQLTQLHQDAEETISLESRGHSGSDQYSPPHVWVSDQMPWHRYF